MADEDVLFHSDDANVTVTNERLILGDDVTAIERVEKAGWSNSEGIKEYGLAILFGLAGLGLLFQFNGWSILGLLLLSNPLLVFLTKKKYWLFVFLRSGADLTESVDGRRMYEKEVAQGASDAINTAVHSYRLENDPRKGLDL